MSIYKKILVAVDLSEDAKCLLQRASEFAEKFTAELTLIHVVQPLVVDVGYDLAASIPQDIDLSLVDRAEKFLTFLKADVARQDVACFVKVGSIKGEILTLAKEQQADLIIIGTHGRHGVALLLGSNAGAVLHGTPCDVLAVRVGMEAHS